MNTILIFHFLASFLIIVKLVCGSNVFIGSLIKGKGMSQFTTSLEDEKDIAVTRVQLSDDIETDIAANILEDIADKIMSEQPKLDVVIKNFIAYFVGHQTSEGESLSLLISSLEITSYMLSRWHCNASRSIEYLSVNVEGTTKV